ncbi:hypothetical protein [Mariprofundus sp. KV]|uniref:hypothetical protein n=1 Tax=Mariprofundus sp. KV TaxID=2608715 RepID=UPI0015A2BB61|nr:hypothetical protein [Mariprofundus sp. KV]NWF36919.1 hypothetical protein [Mariprofundus sp. KV]
MPIVPEYKPNGVIVWHSGIVTGDEFFSANGQVYSHKYDEGLLFQLLEFSNVEEVKLSSHEIKSLANMDKNRVKETEQFACVVAPTDTLYGFSRQWNIQAENDAFHTNVVRSMDEAITWFASKGITVTLEKQATR